LKKSIVLVLADEELFELSRIMQDADEKEALSFLNKYVKPKLQQAIEGL
jgi:hypothetical protein